MILGVLLGIYATVFLLRFYLFRVPQDWEDWLATILWPVIIALAILDSYIDVFR
jgi:hypothetical protein